ncbi:ZIP family metal transporter [Candidatus Micrarchaeota archaeon]|nr:ZIP family metal transporter [Candidatus Micrarchaeota archaeon]
MTEGKGMDAKMLALGIIPLLLFSGLLALFFTYGPVGVIKTTFPPVEHVAFERVELKEKLIIAHVINDGPDPVTIAQVIINDAYWPFETTKSELGPRDQATVTIPYDWTDAEPLNVALLTASGIRFEHEIAVATTSPQPSTDLFTAFAIIGIYVGVMPVFLGLLWIPFLRRLGKNALHFLLSLTIGLLLFLGVDALSEAMETSARVPQIYQGPAIVLIGFTSIILILLAIQHHSRRKHKTTEESRLLGLAYLVAIGIGLHNFGEGLAIGSAYAIGEISLGTALVLGFMIHNITEGIAIAAPISKEAHNIPRFVRHVVQLGLIAGAPVIAGTWVGGFSYSATLSTLFLAVGAGAAFQVVISIVDHFLYQKQELFTPTNVAGVLVGMGIMFATGMLVA